MTTVFMAIGVFLAVTAFSIALMAFGFKLGYEDAVDDANKHLTEFRKEMRAKCECEECLKEKHSK